MQCTSQDYVIYLKTYGGCQLNCSHCMTNGKSGNQDRFDLESTLDWLKQMLDYCQVNEPNGSIHIEFHGGEPLLGNIADMITLVDALNTFDYSISFGITSNLVLKLDDQIFSLLERMDGIGTSWDVNIRFDNAKQEALWESNARLIRERYPDKHMVINIALDKNIVEYDLDSLIRRMIDLGFNRLSFDRITYDGLAILNSDNIIPSNEEINEFYMRLHNVVESNGYRDQIYISNLEDIYAKFELGIYHSGTFARDCERKIFTINPDGSIGGCPNSATIKHYGHIKEGYIPTRKHKGRMINIVKEIERNPKCNECKVMDICTGDCYQLKWQGYHCPAPRELMVHLKEIYNANSD